MNERETRIMQLVKDFWDHVNIDEATIDANFLFRFEVSWCKWVSNIQKMMWNMVGQFRDGPLSLEMGVNWLVHLWANPRLSVGMETLHNRTYLTMTTSKGGYHCCFDKDLGKKYNAIVTYDVYSPEFEDLHRAVWVEAKQTVQIQKELKRLAQAYHLIPIAEDEVKQFAPNEIEDRFRRVVDWVIWEKSTPDFLWHKTILLESKTDKKVQRTLRPHRWFPHILTITKPKLQRDTRLRTWAIYYLSKRGGGEKTEQLAIDTWNQVFRDSLDLRNYKKERERLFKHGSQKGVN